MASASGERLPVSPLVESVLRALDRPSTLKALVRKTHYPSDRVLHFIQQARIAGYDVRCIARGDVTEPMSSYFEVAQ